jgi:hypothetical protein
VARKYSLPQSALHRSVVGTSLYTLGDARRSHPTYLPMGAFVLLPYGRRHQIYAGTASGACPLLPGTLPPRFLLPLGRPRGRFVFVAGAPSGTISSAVRLLCSSPPRRRSCRYLSSPLADCRSFISPRAYCCDFSSSVACKVGSGGCPSSARSASTSRFAVEYSPSVICCMRVRSSVHLPRSG